jgi:4-hydroxy-3-polyprenylbenzoate decarboxylase
LKEGKPLVLMVRETPLHLGHVRLMGQAIENGAIIAPPVPAFYHQPKSVDDIVRHSVTRVIDRLGLPGPTTPEWPGLGATSGSAAAPEQA